MKNCFLSKMIRAERPLRRKISAVVGAFFLLLVVGAVSAQEFREAPVDESIAGQKDATLSGGDAEAVKAFLSKYYLARWTVQANGAEFFDYRKELIADATSLSGDAQKVFLDAVVDRLAKYAKASSVYPACRFNSVLAIGALDSAAGASNREPGTPYAGAVPTLIEFCTTTDDIPVYVRYGALIGLARHAELANGNQETMNALAPVFIDVLKPNYVADKNLREEVYEWFQIKALEGLANFKTAAGPNGATETLDSFKAIVDDADVDFELRALAARGIGAMNLAAVENYNFVDLARSLTTLARDFSDDGMRFVDSELLREQVKNSAAAGTGGGMGASGGMMGGGMGSSGGMMGGAVGQQSQKSLETVVARVQYGFESIQEAIEGSDGKSGVVAKLTADDEATKEAKANLTTVVEEIEATVKFIAEGPKDGGMAGGMGGMYGGASSGMYGGMNARGGKGAKIAVDSATLKDWLLEKKNGFNEILGVDSL